MKQRKNGMSKVLYFFGVLFVLVAAFKLIVAVGSNNVYLQSMEASFGDMWKESLVNIIEAFAPYLGIGIVCIGLGAALNRTVEAAADDRGESDVEEVTEAFKEHVEDLSEEIAAQRKDTTLKIDDIRMAMNRDLDAFKIQREAAEVKISRKLDELSEAGEQEPPKSGFSKRRFMK